MKVSYGFGFVSHNLNFGIAATSGISLSFLGVKDSASNDETPVDSIDKVDQILKNNLDGSLE